MPTKVPTPAPDYGTDIDAFVMAQEFVKKRLKAPSTARFPHSPEATITRIGNGWMVKSYVDSQNAFGAMLRVNWMVRLHKDPRSDNWRADDVVLEE